MTDTLPSTFPMKGRDKV